MVLDRGWRIASAVMFWSAVCLPATSADVPAGLRKVAPAPSDVRPVPARRSEPVTRARQPVDVPAAVAEMGPRRWRTQVPDSLEQGFQLDRNSPWNPQARLFDPPEIVPVSRTVFPEATKAIQDTLRGPKPKP
jgi:hypothetical protein